MTELNSGTVLRGQRCVHVGSEWILRDVSFRLIKQLGQGGMATVWLALTLGVATTDPDAQVAIKVLGTGNGPGSGGTQTRFEINTRFDRERELLMRLPPHPHIVRFIAFGETDDGDRFFVMRYHDGMTLDAYIWQILESRGLLVGNNLGTDTASIVLRQRGTEEVGTYPKHESLFPYPAVFTIIRALLSAVRHCHAHGVTHRDLKPQNVVLSYDGITPRNVTVLDFGIAKIAYDADGKPLTPLTRNNMVLGTPSYMSPEQLKGDKIDVRTDMFAIGMIALEIIAGVRRGASKENMTGQLSVCVLYVGSHDPGDYVTNAPPSMRALLRTATAHKPEDRYQTLEAMMAALDEAERLFAVETGSRPPSQLRRLSEAATVRASATASGSSPAKRWLILMPVFVVTAVVSIVVASSLRSVKGIRSDSSDHSAVPARRSAPEAPRSELARDVTASEASARGASETAKVTFRLGEVYLERGRVADACAKFRQVADIAPDHPGLSDKLARCGSH